MNKLRQDIEALKEGLSELLEEPELGMVEPEATSKARLLLMGVSQCPLPEGEPLTLRRYGTPSRHCQVV